MKKILFTLIALLLFSRAFSQTNPVTPAPINPVQLNTNTFYFESSTKRHFVWNGSTYLWWQPTDSIQVARMIANSMGAGYVTAAGNNNFTGTNTFQNTTNFNGNVNLGSNATITPTFVSGTSTPFLFVNGDGKISASNGLGFYNGSGITWNMRNTYNAGATFNSTPPDFNNSFNFHNGDNFSSQTDNRVLVYSPSSGDRTGYVLLSSIAPTPGSYIQNKSLSGSPQTGNAYVNGAFLSGDITTGNYSGLTYSAGHANVVLNSPSSGYNRTINEFEDQIINTNTGQIEYQTDVGGSLFNITALKPISFNSDVRVQAPVNASSPVRLQDINAKQDTATNTLQTVTYRSRYSRNSTVIGSKALQTSPASLTSYLMCNSYGLPTGPYLSQLGAVQRLTNVLRHNLTNYSISGTTKAQLTPGDSSMVNRLYRIPTYNSSTMGYYVVWSPVNDCFNSVDTAVYRSASVTIANNLVSKGWPANKVIWGGQSYYTVNSTNLNIPKYNYVDSTLAKTYGFVYANTYEVGNYLHLSDGVHGNTTYNELMGARFIRAINATSGADLFVKGQLMSDGLTVYLPQTNSDKRAALLIADSASTITSTNAMLELNLYSNTNASQPIVLLKKNAGSVNSKRFTPTSAITGNGSMLGAVQTAANGGAGDLIAGEISSVVNGTPTATNVPIDMSVRVMGLDLPNRQITQTWVNNGSILFPGSVTNGVSTLTLGIRVNQTLNAGVNNGRLYDMDFGGTKNVGAFTGVSTANIRLNDKIVPLTTATIDLGTTALNFNNLYVRNVTSNSGGLGVNGGTGGGQLNIAAGSSTLAAFTLASGADKTTKVAGEFYYNGTRLGFTPAGTTLKRIPTTNDVSPVAFDVPIGNGTDFTVTNLPTVAPVILATITGINAKTTGTTAVYTVPAGKTAVVTGFIVRCTAASAITSGPTVSVTSTTGTVYASTALGGLTTANTTFSYGNGISVSPVAADVINFVIGTAATGTSQTVEITLIGYLR